jgi:hypothetical protein
VRDGGLKGVEAVIQRQEGVPPEGDNDRLLLGRQDRRVRRLGAGALVIRRGALLPFGDSLLIDPVALSQSPQALFTMLYRSTDCRSRTGAPVENLAHSASLHSNEKSAPSKPGIKQKLMQRVHQTGSTAPAKIGGYRRPLLEPHADRLREIVKGKKGITLREIRDTLAEQGITVKALSTIADMLHRLGLSHKKRR